jgi:hypothetical protein
MLTPLDSVGCNTDDSTHCDPDSTVDLSSVSTFEDTNGPRNFTKYQIVLLSISKFR